MAKTQFTEIRLERITRKLEFEMCCSLQQISSNIQKFESGERSARETLSWHRNYMNQFLRYDRNYLRAISAANRIDQCEDQLERHYRTITCREILTGFHSLCEFFKKQ